ncbi:MAG TPA: hypothetical protein VHC49_23650 [Mycobacteriales bacterium]|nr:hypothetical protein [Mycobacteriales bacterium]
MSSFVPLPVEVDELLCPLCSVVVPPAEPLGPAGRVPGTDPPADRLGECPAPGLRLGEGWRLGECAADAPAEGRCPEEAAPGEGRWVGEWPALGAWPAPEERPDG